MFSKGEGYKPFCGFWRTRRSYLTALFGRNASTGEEAGPEKTPCRLPVFLIAKAETMPRCHEDPGNSPETAAFTALVKSLTRGRS